MSLREDVADLSDAVDLAPGVADVREVVRAARLEREVVAVRRPLVRAWLAGERPRDHTADSVLAGEDLARDAAAGVELLQRDRVLVRGDLEDRVGARVDDPFPRSLMLFAELLDDLRAARRPVAEHTVAGPVHEGVDHLVREPERVRRHRLRRHDPHQLPVADRRVLALRTFEQAARNGRRARLWRTPFERLDVPEPERLQGRQVETADGPGDVGKRVRPLVAELGRIRQRAGSDGVQHNDARARHRAILLPWPTYSD